MKKAQSFKVSDKWMDLDLCIKMVRALIPTSGTFILIKREGGWEIRFSPVGKGDIIIKDTSQH